MKTLISTLLFIVSITAFGKPLYTEFWFLSPDSTVTSNFHLSRSIASNYTCIEMGDGCFHPQLGYIEEDKPIKKSKDGKAYPSVNAIDLDLIDCKGKDAFNLFCGNRKGDQSDTFEVWVDISTSMRKLTLNSKECKQGQFLRNLEASCKKRIHFRFFNTKVSGYGSPDDACQFIGLNNRNTLVEEIESSSAARLIIITDVDEYSDSLRYYIEKNFLATHGIGPKITLDSLDSLMGNITKHCN